METKTEVLLGREFVERAIEIINNAKTSLSIVVFDWRWYPNEPAGDVGNFNRAVASASERGVHVRCIVNSDDIAKKLSDVGVLVHRVTTKRLVHVKLILVDEKIAITGSHNYTAQAFAHNIEASVVLRDENFNPKFCEFFENLWQL